jgi:hypothetical protein
VNSHLVFLTSGRGTKTDKIHGKAADLSYQCMGPDEGDEWVQVQHNTLCRIWCAIQPGMKMYVSLWFPFLSLPFVSHWGILACWCTGDRLVWLICGMPEFGQVHWFKGSFFTRGKGYRRYRRGGRRRCTAQQGIRPRRTSQFSRESSWRRNLGTARGFGVRAGVEP